MAKGDNITPQELEQIRELFMEHHNVLVVYTYGLTYDWETAEGLVRDVFVDLLRDPQPILSVRNPLFRLKKACQKKFAARRPGK